MRKLLLPFLAVLLFTACQKQISKEQVSPQAAIENSGVAAKASKIDVCHKAGPNNWQTINISINALPAHLAHGDIVPEADGDGYTKVNPCGYGNQDDCDDTNPAIHPGATEICGNNIDDNCNGQVDENCSVNICNQTWMQKNLDVSTYRDGTTIPQVTDPTAWTGLTTGAWCYYNNDPANGAVYGKLYNWYAVNDPRGLAPTGWHIPTDAEWTTLTDCLGGESIAGDKMRSTGTIEMSTGLWAYDPNIEANNSSGFTGLPGGLRYWTPGLCGSINQSGYWWSVTEVSSQPLYRQLANYTHFTFWGYGNKGDGFSIRCIKD